MYFIIFLYANCGWFILFFNMGRTVFIMVFLELATLPETSDDTLVINAVSWEALFITKYVCSCWCWRMLNALSIKSNNLMALFLKLRTVLKGSRHISLTTSLPSVNRLSRKCGNFYIPQPYAPAQPVAGISLPFTFLYIKC
jgi:hypothetical protein